MADTAADAVLCAIAAQLDEIMAQQALTQAEVYLRSGGRVAPMSVSRVLRARNHQISTLVDLFDGLGYRVRVVVEQKREPPTTASPSAGA